MGKERDCKKEGLNVMKVFFALGREREMGLDFGLWSERLRRATEVNYLRRLISFFLIFTCLIPLAFLSRTYYRTPHTQL